jgi:hypothetical protein
MDSLKTLNDYRLKYHVTPIKTSSNEKLSSVSIFFEKNSYSYGGQCLPSAYKFLLEWEFLSDYLLKLYFIESG